LLRDYRDWLISELKLLGKASHHAYSFGQANMAQRAIVRLDEELVPSVFVALDRSEARGALTALEMLAQNSGSMPPELETLRDSITAALVEEPPVPLETGPPSV